MEDVRQRLGGMGLSGMTMEQLSEVEWKLGEIKVYILIKKQAASVGGLSLWFINHNRHNNRQPQQTDTATAAVTEVCYGMFLQLHPDRQLAHCCCGAYSCVFSVAVDVFGGVSAPPLLVRDISDFPPYSICERSSIECKVFCLVCPCCLFFLSFFLDSHSSSIIVYTAACSQQRDTP